MEEPLLAPQSFKERDLRSLRDETVPALVTTVGYRDPHTSLAEKEIGRDVG
jgi:hypothetical protein